MEQPQLHWHGSDKKKTAVPWFEALQGRVLAFSEHCMSWVGFQAEERSRKQNSFFFKHGTGCGVLNITPGGLKHD